jgi:dTDP-4-amino-4,6-dideoxygalactose transaminase
MKNIDSKIPVTKTFLPHKEEFMDLVGKIWENGWITNNGEFVQELESKLKEYLGVKHFIFVNNGTIALQIAYRALDLKDEVITTPFSYVATTSSLVWERCKPVFVDIDKDTYCIDPSKIEAAITTKTSAIVATHVYGNACNTKAIKEIALKHGIKVVYDAAHAFGINGLNGRSLLEEGDISILSFHATKIFHSVEGGGLITNDDELAAKIKYLRNFGHNGEEAFWGLGINGKNSELHAAMGVLNLKYIDEIRRVRKSQWLLYDQLLNTNKNITCLKPNPDFIYNYAYFPIVFQSEAQLLSIRKILNEASVFPRRYFYPTLNKLPYLEYVNMPNAEFISDRVMCLPLFFELKDDTIKNICSIINQHNV